MRQTKSVKTGMENYRPLKLQFPVVGKSFPLWRFLFTHNQVSIESTYIGNQNISIQSLKLWSTRKPSSQSARFVAQSRSFLSFSGLKSWDWLCDLIDGLEVLSSQSSWLDSSRYSSSDNFSQLCYGFQAEIPSSHAISSCTNQEHKNHSP